MSCKDPLGATHHNACDCREAEFTALRAENDRYRKALEKIAEDCRNCNTCGADTYANAALAEDK